MHRDNSTIIRKGGTLEYATHQYNEEYDTSETVIVNVTDRANEFLFKECLLEDGVTLKDLFDIVEENFLLFDTILSYHIPDFIEESKEEIEGEPAFDDDSKLEVYWCNEHDNYEGVNELVSSAGFHAISVKSELPAALDFVPVNHLINMPLILDTNFKIYGRIGYSDKPECFSFGNKTFTLIEIVKAVFHELSFYGPPSRRNENVRALKELSRREINE